MTEITIHIPNRLRPYITAKVNEGFDSAESFLLTLVEAEQLQDAQAGDVLEGLSSTDRTQLNVILRERSKGPFMRLDPAGDALWADIKTRGRQRMQAPQQAHA